VEFLMPTLSDFFATVSDTALRGNALDGAIPGAVKRAIEFIERNYNLPYMRKLETKTVTDEIVIDGVLGQNLKSVQAVRWQDSDSVWQKIVQIDPDQLLSSDGLWPAGYEHLVETDSAGVTTHTLRFDSAFEEATEVEILAWQLTPIDLENPSVADVWLVNQAQDTLLARTMVNLAPVMREPQLMQMYQQLYMEGIKTLVGSTDALEQGNR
jgi:hypothetical protein